MVDKEKELYNRVADVVAEEVVKAISANRVGVGTQKPSPVQNSVEQNSRERAVVTSTGFNAPGIAAALTSTISECGGDIRDISQTIVDDFFTMIMIVEISRLREKGLTFMDFKNRLNEKAKEIGVEVIVFHEDILKSMHRI